MAYKKKNNRPAREGEGRPSKYDPKYCQEIVDYFDIDHYEEKVTAVVTGKGDYTKEEKKEIANSLRFITGFARKINVSINTLHEWAKVHQQFQEAFTRAKQLQEEMIVDNATKGLYNPHFTVFAMKNMCGWRDKTDIEHAVSDETFEKYKSLSIEELKKKVDGLLMGS